jgi:hypothetical protein
MELQIKRSLDALLVAIAAGDGQVIAQEMVKLDEFLAIGRAAMHPQLAHFLQNRSYAKAQMFLSGSDDIPAGICGGGRQPRG